MGQKVNPHGLRVGVIKDWSSRWYAKDKEFGDLLVEDYKIREYIKKTQYATGISRVEIERSANRVTLFIYTGKPGRIIGKGGAGIDALRKALVKMTGKQVNINVMEVKNVDCDAQLVAENIAQQLEKRIAFRKAMKNAIARAIRGGAEGIKTTCSGRLNGAEIARSESYSEGNVPLHTLRANIDYGTAEADTTYGKIGVKVWINKGEVLPSRK
ncbi:MAG: 30S ribosomal protein S3 [Anaerofustis stercorihominis]|nr:30S ribosomal protein S3 [Anaerofustis stercorihominis]